MRTPHNTYYLQLYWAVIDGLSLNEAPLSLTQRIDSVIKHYLRDEYQNPQPPLHEV